MDARDAALQAITPTVMVPRFGQFMPLDKPGHRFLVARDGLWLEAQRPWMYVRRRIGRPSGVPMPYGTIEPATVFAFHIPGQHVDQFVEEARKRLPNECAAWLVWNSETENFDLRMLAEIEADPDRVKFHRPDLGEHEHLVIDLHSHGSTKAFFSRHLDDKDDQGEVKIAGVVGNIDCDTPTFAFRLCAMGLFESIPFRGRQERPANLAVLDAIRIVDMAIALDPESEVPLGYA